MVVETLELSFQSNGNLSLSNNSYIAVLIIAGALTGNIVAEFIDYHWKQVAELKQPRSRQSSIAFGGQIAIISEDKKVEIMVISN